jgi:hypothetical protein
MAEEVPSSPQASEPQPPTPYRYRGAGACRCGRCRCRSLLGPVILVTLGVLFFIPQFVHSVGFGELWPILLIVIGVMKLLESSASTEGHKV